MSTGPESSIGRRPLALPLGLTFAILAAAPFMRELRELFFGWFPGRGLHILAVLLVTPLVVLLVVALVRIRRLRALRYGGLVLVLVLLWLQIEGFSQDQLAASIRAQVNLVERFHIVEYGLLAIVLYRTFRSDGLPWSLLAPLLWIIAAGTADELVQWLSPRRTGEVRDVMMNVVAGMTGLLFAVCLWLPVRRTAARPAFGPGHGLRCLAGVVLLLGVFVDTAHLGYAVDDPEIGRFRSWFDPDQLRAAAAHRARAWDVPEPPTGREVWALQDRFMEEAARHTQHRQESLRDKRYVMAWHANAILERYYAPYLDKRLPNGGNHRLPKRALARIEEHGAPRADPAGYVSPVLRGRIWTSPSKSTFRTAVVVLVVGLWATAAGRRRRQSASPATASDAA